MLTQIDLSDPSDDELEAMNIVDLARYVKYLNITDQDMDRASMILSERMAEFNRMILEIVMHKCIYDKKGLCTICKMDKDGND